MKGKVYLVGAGPGDPRLITLKALDAVRHADVIVYDRLISPILLMHAKPEAKRIYAGKKKNLHTLTQDQINQLLVDYALEGKTVTRLKGGDPTVYGRGGEEAEMLMRHGIDYEIVPGISSIYAVPAYAGIPITHRDYASSFYVVTGHEKPDKLVSSLRWEHIAHAADTLIFLMGVSRIDVICEQLVRHGRDPETPVAVIRWGTRAEQKTLVGQLSDIAQKVRESGLLPPAVIVVGEVVRLRETLQWVEKRPLFGQRILVTRARSQASGMARRIEELGGEAVSFPVLQIEPVRDEKRLAVLDEALRKIDQYDWIVFTSANGVEYTFKRLRELRIDIRKLSGAKIAAIGPQTAAALLERGIVVEDLPAIYQAESLAEHLLEKVQLGERVLVPRSAEAREVLTDTLRHAGHDVTAVDVYDNLPAQSHVSWVVDMLESGDISIITFTSSSSVRYFVQSLQSCGIEAPEHLINRCKAVCIGPITEETARQYGIKVSATAREATIPSMIETLCGISLAGQE